MSRLPDVSGTLTGDDAERFHAMMARRAKTGSAVYGRLMAHPELTRHLSEMGGFLRYGGVLPGDLRELLILATAREAGCGYEWVMHEPIARAEGVPDAAIAALRAGRRPEGLDGLHEAALRIAAAVWRRQPVPQAAHDEVAARLGVRGVIEVVYLVAFYDMFAAGLIGFEVPLPAGTPDPFA